MQESQIERLRQMLGGSITSTEQLFLAFKLLNAKLLEMNFVISNKPPPWWWGRTEETSEYIEVEGD